MHTKKMLVAALVLLSACSTAKESEPPRAATEQLLISTAAERAADRLAMSLPKDTKVFVDAGNFDGYDSKDAVVAIHASLLRQGAQLVSDKKDAQVIVEIRSGAVSVDKKEDLIGIPSFSIPVPLASSPLTTPELALYKDDDQKGVAKFAFVAYDAKDGSLKQSEEPQFGFSRNEKETLLFFISWNSNDVLPDNPKSVTIDFHKNISQD